MAWIFLVLAYGLLKGCREIAKKKALQKNTVIEVLIFYTLLSFVFVLPDAKNAVGIERAKLLPVAFKSFIIFVAWICSFVAIKKLPISLMGILDMSRVLFASLLGYALLKEAATPTGIIGLVLVCLGLYALRFEKKFVGKEHREDEKTVGSAALGKNDKVGKSEINEKPDKTWIFIVMVFVSCILNAVSGMMDKILMKDLTSSELQFWYMLFLVLYYLIYILVTRTKISIKSLFKNGWIWLLSLMFVVADRCLFIANGMPESKLTVMTLIKQTGCIVTILGGKFIFHEKNITYKLICAIIVIAGVVIAVL